MVSNVSKISFYEEQLLMFAYMTYPSQFIRQIQSYKKRRDNRNEENELRGVKSLQQSHWLVSNIEYFLSQLQAAQQGTDKVKAFPLMISLHQLGVYGDRAPI